MSLVRKAVFLSALNQYAVQAISIVTTAVISRLLAPEEVGVFAVAVSICFLASSIRSFGVGEYVVREKTLDKQSMKPVLGVMLTMSWGLGLLLMAAAPFIARFYAQPELTYVLWIIVGQFFLAPYISVPYALLARELSFDLIMRVDLMGSLVRSLVSMALAYQGFSYYSLAWGVLCGVLTQFLIISLIRPQLMPWMPSLHGIGRIARAGVSITLSKTLESSSENSSDLILGRLANMNDVGIFSRGLGLILFLQNLLVKAVSPVALPHLAQVKREGGAVGEAYLQAVSLVGAFALPLFAVVNIADYSMIHALFGDQWDQSVQIASALTFWAMFQALHCFMRQALLTAGKERWVLMYEVVSFVSKAALIVLLIPRGLESVAWGIVISGAIDFAMASLLIYLAHGITPLQVLQRMGSNILVALLCWTVLKASTVYLDLHAMNPWLALLVIGAMMVPVWLVGIHITRSPARSLVFELLGKWKRPGRP